MDIFELIESRRSVFPAQYNNKSIEKSTLLKVLGAANWAPNHRKTEPWRFKIVQGKKKLELGDFVLEQMQNENPDLSSFKKRKTLQKYEASSAIIAICIQRDPKEQLPEWEEIAATAMAVQNLWLACTAEEIGGYWSSPKVIKDFHNFFNFKEGEKCLGLFYMGYYDGDLTRGVRNSSIDNKIEWV